MHAKIRANYLYQGVQMDPLGPLVQAVQLTRCHPLGPKLAVQI